MGGYVAIDEVMAAVFGAGLPVLNASPVGLYMKCRNDARAYGNIFCWLWHVKWCLRGDDRAFRA